MKIIPIKFEHEGKTYTGTFEVVPGAGSPNTWHLMIDGNYFGKLRLTNNGWAFDVTPKTENFRELANQFGNYITAWYG